MKGLGNMVSHALAGDMHAGLSSLQSIGCPLPFFFKPFTVAFLNAFLMRPPWLGCCVHLSGLVFLSCFRPCLPSALFASLVLGRRGFSLRRFRFLTLLSPAGEGNVRNRTQCKEKPPSNVRNRNQCREKPHHQVKLIREIKINVEKNFTARWKQCEKSEPICIEKPHCGEVEGFCFVLFSRFSFTWQVLAHVAAGLGHIHSAGWVHRDVKPDNLAVLDGVVRVLDFGQSAPKHPLVEWKGIVGFRSPVPRTIITQRGGGKKENCNLHCPDRNMPWRCLGACLGGSRHVILQTWFKSHFICGGLTYYNQLTALSCKNIKHFEGAAKPGFWQVDVLVSAVYPLKPNLFNLSEVKNRKQM